MIVSIRLLLKRVVALAVLAKFAAFITIATFRLDYEYEIEYEYEFSNQIRVPHMITYHTNLISNVHLCVSQQPGRVIAWGIQLCRNYKLVLILDLVLVVKSEGRYLQNYVL